MDNSKQNIRVESDLEKFNGCLDVISKNLFKIICVILSLPFNQQGHALLEDDILNTYLDSINHYRDDHDVILINQLATIKNLINRPSYTLTDK